MKKFGFRPEIEGLRAVAATLVAVFHIWMHRPSGAVDVFFVVSGFLITSGLTRQIERQGSVDFARFWARLVRRLWPAALLVLFATIVASVLFLPKSHWRETLIEIAASAVYLQNWRQALGETGSPVLHYWALSMQGQFYLLWPPLLAAAAWVATRCGKSLQGTVTVFLLATFLTSLAYSIVLTAQDQPFAYFNTFARIWEFCIGALLATWTARIKLRKSLRVLCGWLGLAAILSCGALLEVAATFPSYRALWPTLGAALIIVAGTSGSRLGADRLLASRPLVFLGGISYGIYLWHFPILIFTNLMLSPRSASLLTGAAILVASVILAYLTNRFLEQPIRQSRIGKDQPSGALVVAIAAMAPVAIGLAVWSYGYAQVHGRAVQSISFPSTDYPGAAAREPEFASQGRPSPIAIFPGPFAVANDNEFQRNANCGRQAASSPTGCALGAERGAFTLAVVGGAHSAQWLPALREIALRAGWRLYSFTRTNCPFHLGRSVLEYEIPSCRQWNEQVLEVLRKLRPDAVFTTATLAVDGVESIPSSYIAAWQQLAPLGIEVIAVRDNPRPRFDASDCVELHGAERCAMPRLSVLAARNPAEELAHAPANVRFVDLTEYFCDLERCDVVVGNVLVYRKLHHLTTTYVRTLSPMLEREMRRALGPALPGTITSFGAANRDPQS